MKAQNKKAFTLIEVLLAMFLGMMVLFMSFSLLDMNVDQQHYMDEVIKRRNSSSKIVAYMRKDFQGIMDLSLLGVNSSVEAAKDANGMPVVNFVSSGRQSVNEEGIVAPYSEVGYALKPTVENSEVFALYRRHKFFVDLDSQKFHREGEYELLFEGVKSMKVEWINDDNPEWTEEWTQGMPTRVKLTLELLSQIAMENLDDLPPSKEDWDAPEFVEIINIKY